jgi:phospholipase C
VTHPSLPNYLAMTSGSTHGVRNDANPSAHRIPGSSIFSQVAAARLRWATYAESMPSVCRRTDSGRYAVRHNPAAYYSSLGRTCAASDVAMGTTTRGPLLTAVRTGRLAAFSLLVPNLCNDTHDCPVATGDRWLARWLAVILSSKTYAAGRTAVFVTWDEDDNSHANRVALLIVAPSVRPHTVLRSTYTHLNLLRTTEHMLGLPALVPRAASLRRLGHL